MGRFPSRILLGLGLLALTLALVFLAPPWTIVDETQYVLVTEFGRLVAVYGDTPGESGPHGKWPWQTALAVDRRVRSFDPPARELITVDKRNLEVAATVCWRVVDPVRFLQGAGTETAAEARLGERVAAALGTALSGVELSALASTDAAQWRPHLVTSQVLEAVAPAARRDLGVEVMGVYVRRFGHPVEVRPAVFDLIRSERRQVAATLRAEGEAEYRTLVSEADRHRDTILAEAEAESTRIRGKGEAEATRILNEAHAADPQFAAFLRGLDALKDLLDDQTTLVLSSSSPLLKLLTQGPPPELMKPGRGPVRSTVSPTTSAPEPPAPADPGAVSREPRS